MPLKPPFIPAAMGLILGLAVLPTDQASAASGLVEYLYVTPSRSGPPVFTEGGRPISADRFVAAIEQLNADPAFTGSMQRERAARSTMLWSTVGLVALAPALGAMAVYNYQIKPDGVFTRTWMAATFVDVAAATGVGLWTYLRHAQPLYSQDQAVEAAKAYNRKLDKLK